MFGSLGLRILWLGVGCVCAALIAISLAVEPSSEGIGTHTQITNAPCMFRVITGRPCATCGMTTSFAHGARLQLRDAVAAQPMGAVFFVITGVLVPFSIFSGFRREPTRIRLPGNVFWAFVLAFVLAGWAFKVLTSPVFLLR